VDGNLTKYIKIDFLHVLKAMFHKKKDEFVIVV